MTNRIQDLAGDINLSESIFNLVDLIDGALYISSEENKGTTVTITVPAFRIVKFDSHMPTRG